MLAASAFMQTSVKKETRVMARMVDLEILMCLADFVISQSLPSMNRNFRVGR
jgi:hypothetical protein